jgi:hypothetical protein
VAQKGSALFFLLGVSKANTEKLRENKWVWLSEQRKVEDPTTMLSLEM